MAIFQQLSDHLSIILLSRSQHDAEYTDPPGNARADQKSYGSLVDFKSHQGNHYRVSETRPGRDVPMDSHYDEQEDTERNNSARADP
jgi:hypothetical protein